ncbi:hypothetical protein IG557_18485, partial [Vibrio cholerae]|nr:hypothetical protein [Vibrio cholerae]
MHSRATFVSDVKKDNVIDTIRTIKEYKVEDIVQRSVPDRSFISTIYTYIKLAQDLVNKSKNNAFYHIHHYYVDDDVASNVWRGKLRGQINVVASIEKSSRFRTQAKFRTSVEAVSDIDS